MQFRMARIAPTLRSSFVLFLPLLTLALACGYLYIADFGARTRGDDIRGFLLPYARSATRDDSPEMPRLEICIPRDGALRFRGEPVSDQEVRDELQIEARLGRDPSSGFSNGLVCIRADERVPFERILPILAACSDPDTRLWRLRFWTRPEELR